MSLQGKWYNELGSKMVLKVAKGVISGTYISAVGPDGVRGVPFPLAGQLDTSVKAGAAQPPAAIGFVVIWSKFGSVTTWSGQVLENGSTILTTWLLTDAACAGKDWQSTEIGQDVFTRIEPSPEEVATLLARWRMSHPHPKLQRLEL